MSEDFKKEEVIKLAEKLFVQRAGERTIISDSQILNEAKKAIKQAMIFRKAEREIFGEEKE